MGQQIASIQTLLLIVFDPLLADAEIVKHREDRDTLWSLRDGH